MALNLVQHRVDTNVWDQVDRREWDTERWLAAFAAGALATAGLRRRSPMGALMTIGGGVLAWWAAKGAEERTGLRQQVRDALPSYRAAPDPMVQEASEESFPASDAPSWTPTTGNTTTCGGGRSK
jgi:hypothetical protein